MTEYNEQDEKNFLNQFTTESLSITSIGNQGTGKTYFMLNLLKFSMDYNIHQKFHLILPAYRSEQNNSYSFINEYKHLHKNIKIYNAYHVKICDFVHKDAINNNTFLLIDDCTGEFEKVEPEFKKLYTRIRHNNGYKLFIGLCMHYTKIMPPVIRSNSIYLILYFLSNYNVVDDFYDQNLRIIYESEGKNKKDFISDYKKVVMDKKYGAVMLGKNIESKYILVKDFNEWQILQYIPSNGKSINVTKT